MPVRKQDIEIYGSASMPDDDTATNIGGAIDASKRVSFSDMTASGNIQVVSESASDTTQSVAVSALSAAGEPISEAKTLTGTTPVAMSVNTNWKDLLKATKSAVCAGTVAVEAVTTTHSGTAQSGAVDSIVLAGSASATDDAYNNMVIRITGGTGANQIRRVFDYDGNTRTVTPSRDWITQPDATSTYQITPGIVFEKTVSEEIMEVRRICYDSLAEASGGAARNYYEKVFVKNLHSTLSVTNSQVEEAADASGVFDFALESALNGTDTNGVGNNRQVAPAAYTFDSTTKPVSNGQNLSAGSAQGVWCRLSLAAGQGANDTELQLRITGQSAP